MFTDLEVYFLCVLGYLSNSWVTLFSWHTHPGVNSCHCNAELLHGYYNNAVRNTWRDTWHRVSLILFTSIRLPVSSYNSQSRGYCMSVWIHGIQGVIQVSDAGGWGGFKTPTVLCSMFWEAITLPVNSITSSLKFIKLTDGSEDACEAEIVYSVEREQVEQELLPFFFAEQECMWFIQLPVRGQMKQLTQNIYF